MKTGNRLLNRKFSQDIKKLLLICRFEGEELAHKVLNLYQLKGLNIGCHRVNKNQIYFFLNTVMVYRIVKCSDWDVLIRTLDRDTHCYIIYIRSVKLFLTSYINNTQQTAYFQPPSSRCIDNLAFSELNLFHVSQMFQVLHSDILGSCPQMVF